LKPDNTGSGGSQNSRDGLTPTLPFNFFFFDLISLNGLSVQISNFIKTELVKTLGKTHKV